MKRYRIGKFYLDTSRNILGDKFPKSSVYEKMKREKKDELVAKYGVFDFDSKFQRYIAIKPPVLSVIEEHSFLQQDIIDAYINGNFYSALTGACCLGERIFNNIIFKVKEDFRVSRWYKEVYHKGSIIDWLKAIQILSDWKIIDESTQKQYLDLYRLRTDSVHYQKKEQDLEIMSFEAISIVVSIITKLFSIDETKKKFLLYFDVPGEIFIRKEAEVDPMIKAFFIPCSVLVGPEYSFVTTEKIGTFKVVDKNYGNREITDEEFVQLRIKHTGK